MIASVRSRRKHRHASSTVEVVKETATHNANLVLAIKTEYGGMLFEGTKRVELRTTLPKRLPRRVYLYETAPASAITGHLVIDGVCTAEPDELWSKTGQLSGVNQEEFNAYFDGHEVGHAFFIQHAVRYEHPITLSNIQNMEPEWHPPQSFSYLDKFVRLSAALDTDAFKASILSANNSIQLALLEKADYPLFIDLVDRHISRYYRETGSDYARKLIGIYEAGVDAEGILTQRKFHFSVRQNGEMVGFTSITEKAGGSVKIGPTALDDKWIGKGVGTALFPVLTEALCQAGYRNAYFTVSTTNKAVINIFLGLGYRIEAQMARQYHEGHDELAMSKSFTSRQEAPPAVAFLEQPIDRVDLVQSTDDRIVEFLDRQFPLVYRQMPQGWANKQIAESVASLHGEGSSFKPRYAFAGYSGDKLTALALCLVKRGGGAKMIFLSQSSHQESISRMLRQVENALLATSSFPIRRFYTHVSDDFLHVYKAFKQAGYANEGCMTRPYNDFTDMLVLGKSID
ncbi:MAG: GNAT family N-acetyltransferase [Candidatus Obscuribacterales bacterium]|nr:GNAT family N-acetyltransferase [Candidatus Obscuribacterales bacterium]